MTTEGLANLKKVLRKAIELQVNATLVMATLQSIYCDEADELDKDAEEHLLSAITSARGGLDYAMDTLNDIQKAYGIEKGLAMLDDILDNEQDNGTGRTK